MFWLTNLFQGNLFEQMLATQTFQDPNAAPYLHYMTIERAAYSINAPSSFIAIVYAVGISRRILTQTVSNPTMQFLEMDRLIGDSTNNWISCRDHD